MAIQRIEPTPDEPLPNGGAYAILSFHDADGSPVERSDAAWATVVEYSSSGNPLFVSFLDLKGVDENSDSNGAGNSTV